MPAAVADGIASVPRPGARRLSPPRSAVRPSIGIIARDPFLAKLRGEPRFEALMSRVKRQWEAFEA